MRHASKIVKTFSDMGNIKIFSKSLSCFFDNGAGDGGNVVKIYGKGVPDKATAKMKFLGHFTVRGGENVSLSEYDCEDDPACSFAPGRWFVYLEKPAHFVIALTDTDEDSLRC